MASFYFNKLELYTHKTLGEKATCPISYKIRLDTKIPKQQAHFVHIFRVTQSKDLVQPVPSHETPEEADHMFTTPTHICLGCDHPRICAYYIRNARVALQNCFLYFIILYMLLISFWGELQHLYRYGSFRSSGAVPTIRRFTLVENSVNQFVQSL